jgi:hypothetical protein
LETPHLTYQTSSFQPIQCGVEACRLLGMTGASIVPGDEGIGR